MLNSNDLKIDESSLTGESDQVKCPEILIMKKGCYDLITVVSGLSLCSVCTESIKVRKLIFEKLLL